jgi:hypothetical protein
VGQLQAPCCIAAPCPPAAAAAVCSYSMGDIMLDISTGARLGVDKWFPRVQSQSLICFFLADGDCVATQDTGGRATHLEQDGVAPQQHRPC